MPKTAQFVWLLFFLSTISYGKIVPLPKDFIQSKSIQHKNASGYYPVFNRQKYPKINQTIQHFIFQDVLKHQVYDHLSFNYTILAYHQNIISLKINYDMSNFTEHHFTKYYSFDLNTQKPITLNQFIQQKNLSKSQINHQLNTYFQPCKSSKNKPDYCNDVILEHIMSFFNPIHVQYASGFYLKNDNNFSIAFQGSKFSHSFDFKIQHRRAILQQH